MAEKCHCNNSNRFFVLLFYFPEHNCSYEERMEEEGEKNQT
jgi:hypothetical protein